MNKVIRSQDNQQIHYMPASSPCYFNVAPVLVDGKKEGEKTTLHSLGINNVSFGIFTKKRRAEEALNALEAFLLDEFSRFQVPKD